MSHGQLLIRSDKRKEGNVNIDIIFYDTTFMQLFTMLWGLAIRFADKSTMKEYASVENYLNFEKNNLFEIQSGGREILYGRFLCQGF